MRNYRLIRESLGLYVCLLVVVGGLCLVMRGVGGFGERLSLRVDGATMIVDSGYCDCLSADRRNPMNMVGGRRYPTGKLSTVVSCSAFPSPSISNNI